MSDSKKDYTVLITDDEKANLDILGSILSPIYNILVATNGTRALELAREHKPDLILLDVVMPEMSGFDVIVKLKDSDLTDKIPVIFITGLTGEGDEEKGFFLGAVDYIAKPFKKAIVKARVETHIKILDQMRTIERIGLTDPLTRISNRRGFEGRLNAEWGNALRNQMSLGVLMLDVDKFKNYNDTYGHQQGDLLLKAFAEVAAQTLMRSSDFVARWGGEEFIVLLPGISIDGAANVGERIRANIEAMVVPAEDGTETRVTVSVGANSIIPGADNTIKDFINKADAALYRAKELGRNRVEKSAE